MKLHERVAIITGGGSGIGAATAVAMAAEGARVLVADVNETGAKSVVQRIESAGGQAHAASEGAVVTLTKALALETAPHGVRVVAIAPVATHTPMLPTFMGTREVDAEGLAKYEATVPLGRLNQPEDIAGTAVFLAS